MRAITRVLLVIGLLFNAVPVNSRAPGGGRHTTYREGPPGISGQGKA